MTRFGHLAALMWARLILSRFRDAVLPDSTFTSADSGAYFNAFFSDSSRGVYHLRADMSRGLGFSHENQATQHHENGRESVEPTPKQPNDRNEPRP
jgi:hypothetical protein